MRAALAAVAALAVVLIPSAGAHQTRGGHVECAAVRVLTRPSWRAGGTEPVSVALRNLGDRRGRCTATLTVNREGPRPERWLLESAPIAPGTTAFAAPHAKGPPGIPVPTADAGAVYHLQACVTGKDARPRSCSAIVDVKVRPRGKYAEPVLRAAATGGLDCAVANVKTLTPWRATERNNLTLVVQNRGTSAGRCWLTLRVDPLEGSPTFPAGTVFQTFPTAVIGPSKSAAVVPTGWQNGIQITSALVGTRYRLQVCATGKTAGGSSAEASPANDCSPPFGVSTVLEPLAGTWTGVEHEPSAIASTEVSAHHFVGVVTDQPAAQGWCAYTNGQQVWNVTVTIAGHYTGTFTRITNLGSTGPCQTETLAATIGIVLRLDGSWSIGLLSCRTAATCNTWSGSRPAG